MQRSKAFIVSFILRCSTTFYVKVFTGNVNVRNNFLVIVLFQKCMGFFFFNMPKINQNLSGLDEPNVAQIHNLSKVNETKNTEPK